MDSAVTPEASTPMSQEAKRMLGRAIERWVKKGLTGHVILF